MPGVLPGARKPGGSDFEGQGQALALASPRVMTPENALGASMFESRQISSADPLIEGLEGPWFDVFRTIAGLSHFRGATYTPRVFDPRTYTPRPDELAGRVVAVTGASDGLGRAVALACAQHGGSVVLVGRNEKKLEAVHAEIAALAAPEAAIGVLDLERALAADYDRLAAALDERYGRLDGLLHNAALLGRLSPIEHYDVPTWCRVLHVNLTAAFALTQVLLPLLKRSADASVVFTSSSVGRRGRAYWGAYAVSKFALEGLSQVLADELEGTSAIRVNTLNPGRARTAMRRQAYPAEDVATVPSPATLTGPYIALLGPASRGVTGGAFDAQPPASAAASDDRSSRSSPDSSSRA